MKTPNACGNCFAAPNPRTCPTRLSMSAWGRKLRRPSQAVQAVISLEGGCKYQGERRRRPSTYAASDLKPSQCTLDETLTLSLALFGHVHNVLREGVPSSLEMTIRPESGSIGLDSLPSIVQRPAQNGNGLGVERCGILEIPEHRWHSIRGGSTTSLSAIGACLDRDVADDD
jgi:hypothetical protein